MKKIRVFLIIAICLAIVVVPATAAKEDPGDHAGLTATPAENHYQDPANRNDAGDTLLNRSSERETVREVRADAHPGAGEINRTPPPQYFRTAKRDLSATGKTKRDSPGTGTTQCNVTECKSRSFWLGEE